TTLFSSTRNTDAWVGVHLTLPSMASIAVGRICRTPKAIRPRNWVIWWGLRARTTAGLSGLPPQCACIARLGDERVTGHFVLLATLDDEFDATLAVAVG